MLTDQLLQDIQEYIELHTIVERFSSKHMIEAEVCESALPDFYELDDFIHHHKKPTFREVLFSYMDDSGEKDAAVYTRAGLDRRHFSKIRGKRDYKPKKDTVIALALALRLDMDQTDELLTSAGYSLSQSDDYDLIIQYFIEKQTYDIGLINEALYALKGRTLAGAV
ncbi:hypothetical protein ACFQPF_11500 [Fictibacillus iocasae]|uniref:Appr-1-p processing protein n=1 Tax=Fictibacillus iocasae TaxID=2715437 RepID=A0ABW2NSK5_9BACL